MTENKNLIQPQRQKLDTDLISSKFALKWFLINKKGHPLRDYKTRVELFEEFYSLHPDLFTKVLSNKYSLLVLAKENIPAFKTWLLRKKGITASETKIAGSTNKNQKRTETVSPRQICDTDIIKAQFLLYFRFTTLNKRPALNTTFEKAEVWKELEKQEAPNLLVQASFGDYQTYVLPKENIAHLKQWFYKQKCILLSVPNELDEPENSLLSPKKNSKDGR